MSRLETLRTTVRLRWLKVRVRRARRPAWWYMLRGTEPASRSWGFDRGKPVDRYYIDRFLAAHRADITGRVLEVKAPLYTEQFGIGVRQSDVLDVRASNPQATIIADLTCADGVPDEQFDCFVLTQTLQLIYEPGRAIAHARRILRPRGVLLATVPAVSPVVPTDDEPVDYWRFTPAACSELFSAAFGAEAVTVESFGNYRTAVAFLSGLALEELSSETLDHRDERYPVIVAVRAVKLVDRGTDRRLG